MSSINDPEQLTGSSRVYANAKPGIIMEAFAAWQENPILYLLSMSWIKLLPERETEILRMFC